MSRIYQFENSKGWFFIDLDSISAITKNSGPFILGPTLVYTGSKDFQVSLSRDQVAVLVRTYKNPEEILS